MFEQATTVAFQAFDADAIAFRTADTVRRMSTFCPGGLQTERRFHDEMEGAVRPNQHSKIRCRLGAIGRRCNIEQLLCVLEKQVHLKVLSDVAVIV